MLVRYFMVAGGAYWLFYFSSHKFLIKQSVDIVLPNQEFIRNDIVLSVIATFASAICAALVMISYDSGATLLYQSIEDYGVWYLITSFWIVILLQDTCYYFFHRGLHHPLFYNWLHRGHHHSKNPTPWTSFALDFPEALIQGLFVVAVIALIPMHHVILALWLLTMTIWSLVNHLGFELFSSFSNCWLGKWLISSNHHSLHHRRHTRHFGLYFTFWDRILGTN
ncbi:MAG: sterol desaturase family protein [Cyanobacteria bacterium P01_E01_bin.35]